MKKLKFSDQTKNIKSFLFFLKKQVKSIVFLTGSWSITLTAVHATIWTDADSPKPRIWLNTVNYDYGPILDINNNNTFYFSDSIPNVATVAVESGGVLTASGLLNIKYGAYGNDALLVAAGGQAYLNGGLYAENTNISSDFYVVAVHQQNSKLIINGNTTVVAPEKLGVGIHIGNANNTGIFDGDVRVSAGKVGIYNAGTSEYKGLLEVDLKGEVNSNSSGIYINHSTSGLLTFHDKVNIRLNSDSTSYNYGIYDTGNNTGHYSTFLDKLGIDLTNVSGAAVGIYSGGGIINIDNDLTIKNSTTSSDFASLKSPDILNINIGNIGNIDNQTIAIVDEYALLDSTSRTVVPKYAIFTNNIGQVNINESLVDLIGRIQASAASLININTLPNSKIIGDSIISDSGIINYNFNRTNWFLTGDSQLSSFNTANSNIYLNYNSAKSYRTLTSSSLSGNNSAFYFNTLLDDGSSQETDKLIIKGAATGNHKVVVNNTTGDGAKTNKGIHIIQTISSSEDTFYLEGNAVSVGAYDYSLHLKENEQVNLETFDNWYLESKLRDTDIPVYTPDVGEYLAAETMGNTLFTSRLEDREGASQYQNLGNTDTGNIWVRAYGGHNKFKTMDSQLKTTGNSFVTQIGAGLITLGEEDQYNLGAMTGFAYYDGKTRSNLTDRESKTKIDGYSLGLYGTWYAHPVEKRGAYIDSWVLWNKFNNKIDTADQNQYKYDSSGITASIEVGGDYLLNKNGKKDWWIQPQAQLIYQGVHADNIQDAQGVDINHGKDNLQARMGVKTYLNIPTNGNKLTSYRPYVALNFIHNTNPYSVEINDIRYENEGSANLGELKLGIEGNVTQNSQVWLNASYVAGSHDNQSYQGNIGWKYNF